MANLQNVALRNRILERRVKLLQERTVGDRSIPSQIAEEFGISYQMACYYLRGGNKSSTTRDGRRAYSLQEIHNLELMTTVDRESYAVHTGRSLRAVDAALARYRKSFKEYIETTKTSIPMAYRTVTERGHLNFASLSELKSVNFTREAVEEAKQNLKPYGLALRAPNILFHKHTNRRLDLDVQQQMYILSDTKKFLQVYSKYIKEHWYSAEVDPIADGFMDVVSPDYVAPVQHRKTRNNVLCASIRSKADALVKLLEDAATFVTLQHGFPVCESLKILKVWVDKALETAHPESHYIDHVGVADKKNVQWVGPEDDASMKGRRMSPEGCEVPAEDGDASPTAADEDDAWIKDFKSVN